MSKNLSLVIFLVLLAALSAAAGLYTGTFIPPSGDASIWFYGGLFAVLTGKFIVEYRFTKPNDVVVNCVAAFLAISTLNSPPNGAWWETLRWGSLALATLALLLAWNRSLEAKLGQSVARTIAYRIVTRLGSAEVLFSFVFILGLISYTQLSSANDQAFVFIWGAILLAANLGLASWPAAFALRRDPKRELIGVTHSFLSPSLVYCRKLTARTVKPHEVVAFANSPSGKARCYGMIIDELPSATETLVTVALLHQSVSDACLSQQSVLVSLSPEDMTKARETLGTAYPDDAAKVVGTVAEGTRISQLRFEVFGSPDIFAGSLLAVGEAARPIFTRSSKA